MKCDNCGSHGWGKLYRTHPDHLYTGDIDWAFCKRCCEAEVDFNARHTADPGETFSAEYDEANGFWFQRVTKENES